MMLRRGFLVGSTLVAGSAFGADGFAAFIAGVKAEAARAGVRRDFLAGVRAPERVAEGSDWEAYRGRLVSEARVARGRALVHEHHGLLEAMAERFLVPPMPVVGIWGAVSGFGPAASGRDVVEALAGAAYSGPQAGLFRKQLLGALTVLDRGDAGAGALLGDVFGAIAGFLAGAGWTDRVPWGIPAEVPAGFDGKLAGRERRRALDAWIDFGVVPKVLGLPGTTPVALVLLGREAFLVCPPNFAVMRRFEASDFFAVGAGLLGDRVVG